MYRFMSLTFTLTLMLCDKENILMNNLTFKWFHWDGFATHHLSVGRWVPCNLHNIIIFTFIREFLNFPLMSKKWNLWKIWQPIIIRHQSHVIRVEPIRLKHASLSASRCTEIKYKLKSTTVDRDASMATR